MFFRKKRREDIWEEKREEFLYRDLEESKVESETTETTEVEETLEYEDLMDALDRLEKFCLNVLMSTSDPETREKMFKLFGRIKLVKASRGTPLEDLINLMSGEKISNSSVEKLKEMGLLEMKYTITGHINLSAKDRSELSKKLEELIRTDFCVSDEVLEVIDGLPYRVEEENSELAGKLYNTGAFEIYLLPKGWFDMPNIYDNPEIAGEKVERIHALVEKLPQNLKGFLRV